MKNVLMIVYIFPPMGGSGVQRTLKFVKYLPLFGWNPLVVTVMPYQWKGMDYTLVKEVPPKVEVYQCYSLELRRAPVSIQPLLWSRYVMQARRVLQVPDHCIGWFPFALSMVRKIMKNRRIDLVYSSFPPGTAHLIAYLLKKQYGIPWVADFRDPWTHHPWFEYRTPRMYRKLVQKLERKCLILADRIVVTATTLKKDFLATYPDLVADKVSIITNGYDEEDFSSVNSLPYSDGFTIVYAGSNIGSPRLDHFEQAVKQLIRDRAIKDRHWSLVFAGDGEGPVWSSDRELEFDGLARTTGFVSHHESIEYLHHADVLLLYSWGRNIIPGKTFEYIRAQRPILTLAKQEDELAAFIRRYGAGVVVAPNNEKAIASALWGMYVDKKASCQRYMVTEEFIAQYERKVLTARLAQVFDELITTKRR